MKNKRLLEVSRWLREFTGDWDESKSSPAEHGIEAEVVGTILDNAAIAGIFDPIGQGPSEINHHAILGGYQEMVVIVRKNGAVCGFNLCDLIALAREAHRLTEDKRIAVNLLTAEHAKACLTEVRR